MTKVYLLFCGMLIFLIAVIGFVVPYLISAADTLLVILGIAVLVIFPLGMVGFGTRIYKNAKKLLEKEDGNSPQ